MAVVVEDGTIVDLANSYGDLAAADTYHEDMGNTAWADLDDEVKEAALIRGTLMIEARFNGRWIGYKTNNDDGDPKVKQRLAWPRRKDRDVDDPEDLGPPDGTSTLEPLKDVDGVEIGVNEIPREVQFACFEAAFMQASGNSLVPDNVGSDKYVKRNKVDVIEQEFFEHRPAIDRFPLIDQLLQNLAAVGEVNLSMVIGITDDERESFENKDDATQNWLDSLSGPNG